MTRVGARSSPWGRLAPLLGALAALLLVLLVLLVPLAGPAAAQTGEEQLTIREVDTTEFPVVRLSALSNGGDIPDPSQFSLRENGEFVTGFDLVPVSETPRQIGTVLVIDTSGSMRARDAIGQAKAAARQFVEQRQPQDRIAIVAFSDQAQVVQDFTDDGPALLAGIDGLQARGETALWDGVRTAGGLLTTQPDLQANVLLLSDGADTASTTTADEALASMASAKATVFSVAIPGSDFDEGPVRRLAEETRGTYAAATDPASLAAVYSSVQRALQGQFEVRYTSTATSGTIQVALSTSEAQARAEAPVGAVAEGAATAPKVFEPEEPLVDGRTGLLAGAGLAFVAIALGVWAVVSASVKEESALALALRPYEPAPVARAQGPSELAQTPIVQRAVAYTEKVARERGILQKVEALLERADLPLNASEALFFYAAGVVVLGALAFFLTGSLFVAGLLLLVIVAAPPAIISFLGGRRQRTFVSQLPDTLQLLAGSLRAGYSLLQGVEAVSKEVGEPMGKELRRVLVEARLGRPVEDALDDAAERLESPDFTWAVMAIRIQREVGGNLAEILVTVAETMTARERLRRDIKSLTAEGRVSAVVLAILPVAIAGAIYVLNRQYMDVLLSETVGQFMLGGSILLACAGFLWLKKIVNIEV